MDDRERAIGARLKAFREDIKWPQPTFAKQMGLSRDQLASIEYGRTPLKYKTGIDLCWAFDLSAEWIVTGQGQPHGGTPVLWEVEFSFEEYGNRLFSEVYDLKPGVFAVGARWARADLLKPTPGFDPETYLLRTVIKWFGKHKFKGPLEAERFARSVVEFADETLREIRLRGKASQSRLSEIRKDYLREKRLLTGVDASVNIPEVKSPLIALRARLDRVTSDPGKKTELATFLDAPLASVSRWLAGKRDPGGETILRLLDWVQAEETKQKGPGHARTRPERKTRNRKSNHEKPKSSPQ